MLEVGLSKLDVGRGTWDVGCWMFDVGRFDVRCPHHHWTETIGAVKFRSNRSYYQKSAVIFTKRSDNGLHATLVLPVCNGAKATSAVRIAAKGGFQEPLVGKLLQDPDGAGLAFEMAHAV